MLGELSIQLYIGHIDQGVTLGVSVIFMANHSYEQLPPGLG